MLSPASPEGQQPQHIRLACQACQRKKIKCDRNFPCGQCLRSNLQCVPSQRKPRARHAGKRAVDSELRSRISKLESLVESLSGEVGVTDDLDDADDGDEASASDSLGPNASVGRYIASPFWSSLTSEVQALREALEEDDDLDDDSFSPGTSSSGTQSQPNNEYDLIICPPGAVYVMPGALNEPSPQLQSELYGIYMETVAPLVRTFHIPSLRKMLERGEPYLGQEANSPANKAVRATLWFAAANTLSEEETQARFGSPKSELINNYRRYVDVLLAQADLMVTTDLATLQSLATYLICSRSADSSRRVWTLTSLLVRIARALGLHHENPGQHSVYLTEIRRRLWQNIRFTDIHCSADRGTEPLILPGTWDTPLAHNVNDTDFDENSTSIVSREDELTDVSFALLAHEANFYTAKLNVAPDANAKGDPWAGRLELAQEFGKAVHEKFLRHCDMNNPHHRVIYRVGRSMAAGCVLRAVRPTVFRQHISSYPPPRIDSPYVLKIAVDAVRESEGVYEDPEYNKWRWLIWVHWHPLAVALAGLCSIRESPLSENAWPIVERAYIRHSQQIADSRNGMLWRPIEKLYKKATTFRHEGRRESQTTGNPTPPKQDTPSAMAMTAPSTWSSPPDFDNLGNIPLDPLLTKSMDFSGVLPDASTAGMSNLSLSGSVPMTPGMPNDTSWLDWERIMTDMSTFDSPDLSIMPDVMDASASVYPLHDPEGKSMPGMRF